MVEKKYYDVVLEANVPCIVKYRVLAESPEDALEEMKRAQPAGIRHNLEKRRNIKATIYDSGSSIIQHIKRWM